MIVYNITMKVHPAIEADWLTWQKEEHIPEIMSTKLFTEYKFYKLLEQDEAEGVTYVVQFFAPTKEHYQKYIDDFAASLRNKATAKWKDGFVGFRTIMQVVH